MGRPKKITPQVEKAPARLPGSFDVLPEQIMSWEVFVEKLHSLAHTFGYSKIETPLVEDARLFRFWQAGSKDKLAAFTDAKGLTCALKPTTLFSLARAYLEYQFPLREKVSKWFYTSPVAYVSDGQMRQSTEYGFQMLGETNPIADSQLINLIFRLFTEMGLPNLSLEINNIGCLECQPGYEEVLRNYFKEKKYDLCENCLELIDTHPLQILACNNLSCSTVSAEAPVIIDYLCDACRRHFIAVLEGLDELNLVYNLNQKVIGKPWSRKTVFEVRAKFENSEVTLGQGGHADDLIQSLGGLPAQALGFMGTIENVLTALESANVKFASKHKADVFLVPLGELAAKKTLRLFTDLWNNNIVASEFIGPGSIKTQLKLAESNKVAIALIIGQKEAREGTVILRDVKSGMQELFTSERIIDEVKKRLGK
ncbi:MAG: ATP phosphoribosyltransferase regulatory subunit [Candidatus Doudnabacteria bacterium]|nr:ATP phosphoribosyltransferase regulatory subunit [Candidatus Doudnabacteria bacterium]